MRRTRAIAIAAAFVLAAFLPAGCGGSSKSKPSQPAGFLARADAICVRAQKRAHMLISASGEDSTLAQIAATRARTAHEISRLTPPPASKALYLRLVSAISQEAALQHRVDEDLHKHEDTAGGLAIYRKLRGNAVSRPARLIDLTDCV
jgi:hypothetical protein